MKCDKVIENIVTINKIKNQIFNFNEKLNTFLVPTKEIIGLSFNWTKVIFHINERPKPYNPKTFYSSKLTYIGKKFNM